MKANCQPVDGVCSQCGKACGVIRVCPNGSRSELVKREPCPHLGEQTGASALVKCGSCGGNTRKKHPVHACVKHGDCTPLVRVEIAGFRGDVKDGRKCAGCADNPRAKVPTRTPTPQSETRPPA